MNEEIPLVVEIGHFEASIQQMLTGQLRYIVSRTHDDIRCVLHADTNEGTHLGVALKAEVDPLFVIGGGFVAWGGEQFILRGQSKKFGEEPGDIRSALILFINRNFHDDLEGYKESRKAQKKV